MRKTEEIINEILNKRGILSDEDREEFLSAKPTRTYDPFLLDSMKAGVVRADRQLVLLYSFQICGGIWLKYLRH